MNDTQAKAPITHTIKVKRNPAKPAQVLQLFNVYSRILQLAANHSVPYVQSMNIHSSPVIVSGLLNA